MPNWCENDEIIVGPDKDIKILYKKIMSAIDSCPADNIFGHWLSPIFKELGLDVDSYDCRGYFTALPFLKITDETQISFSTDTAWSPIRDTWEVLLNEISPACKYYHFSVELGAALAETNDADKRFWTWDYVMDTFFEDEQSLPISLQGLDSQTYWSAEELSLFLTEVLGVDNLSLEDKILLIQQRCLQSSDNSLSIIKVDRYD